MTYRQLIASAMVKMGEGDRPGALADFEAALAEARRVDSGGPREAEVLSTLALFHDQGGEGELAGRAREAAEKIFLKFEVLE